MQSGIVVFGRRRATGVGEGASAFSSFSMTTFAAIDAACLKMGVFVRAHLHCQPNRE